MSYSFFSLGPAVMQDEDDEGEDGVKSLEDDEKDDDEVQVNVHDHSMSLLEEGACPHV